MSASLAARAIPTRSHTSRSRKTPPRHARRRGGRAVGAANAGDALFALSVMEVGGEVLVPDADVAAAAVGALAATSLASLGTTDPAAELRRRVDAVEPLEVRLDVTALWCFVCARELSHVPPGGKVVDLGFSIGDILRLGCVAGTGSCLCIAWLLVGTATGQFKRAGFLATGDERTLIEYLTPAGTPPPPPARRGSWRRRTCAGPGWTASARGWMAAGTRRSRRRRRRSRRPTRSPPSPRSSRRCRATAHSATSSRDERVRGLDAS